MGELSRGRSNGEGAGARGGANAEKGEGRRTREKGERGQNCRSPFSLPCSLSPQLVSEPRRQRHHVARVLLVTEQQASLAERGPAERQGQDLSQLLHQEDLDLVADFLREVLEVGLVLLGQNDLG